MKITQDWFRIEYYRRGGDSIIELWKYHDVTLKLLLSPPAALLFTYSKHTLTLSIIILSGFCFIGLRHGHAIWTAQQSGCTL